MSDRFFTNISSGNTDSTPSFYAECKPSSQKIFAYSANMSKFHSTGTSCLFYFVSSSANEMKKNVVWSGTKYSRMDQVKLWKTAFKKFTWSILEYIVPYVYTEVRK